MRSATRGAERRTALARVAVFCSMFVLVHAGGAMAQCVGDCNEDGVVRVNELVRGVNINLDIQDVSTCPQMDANMDGEVRVNELVRAVNNNLNGCPMDATPTPSVGEATPTPTNTPGDSGFEALCSLSTDSTLIIGTQAFDLPTTPQGNIEIKCGGADAATSGESLACECSILDFAPVVIPSIGDVCVTPFGPCPGLPLDCGGGIGQDADLVGDRTIGKCTSNDDCKSQCESHCQGIGADYSVQDSGCEGFCKGGDNDGETCTLDTDCVKGSCVGSDGLPAQDCNCVCVATGQGEPAPAGAMSCGLGFEIKVELPSNGVCGDPPTIELSPVCGVLTTENTAGLIVNANLTPGAMIGPAVDTGVRTSCEQLASGSASGLTGVGHLAFFGSTLGDILSKNHFVCE